MKIVMYMKKCFNEVEGSSNPARATVLLLCCIFSCNIFFLMGNFRPSNSALVYDSTLQVYFLTA